MGDDNLVTTEGVDDEGVTQVPEPDPAGPGGALPDEPPASPSPTDVPRPPESGQQVQEGEG
jgi:hypothetical protein